jgi:peptide/nickel transport system ATP-binding protein
MSLLEVSELSVRFETEDGPVFAVDELSFSVEPGEVLGVVGESGCGKTVACLSLARLLPENAIVTGRALIDGVDVFALPRGRVREVRGRQIAYVFQEPMNALNPSLTVGRQIGEVIEAHHGLSRSAVRARTIELLDVVQIPAPERRAVEYPHQLSGGMQQRVMIAMALAGDPKVLVADEPTTALDVTTQAAILALMADIRGRLGTAIVLVTHNLGVVAGLADRVLVMYAGRAVEEATVEAIFDDPQHPYTFGLLGAVPRPGQERLREIPGRVPALREPSAGCAFIERCGRADDVACLGRPALQPVRNAHLVACFHPGAA